MKSKAKSDTKKNVRNVKVVAAERKSVKSSSKRPTTNNIRLTLWSYSPTIGTAWVDSWAEVDDGLTERAREDGGGWGPLDLSNIDGELKINGKYADIDFTKVGKRLVGENNKWMKFKNKIGVYSVEIDQAYCSTEFFINGDFDPRKLMLHYKTAIGPGYLEHPETEMLELLDWVSYDGKILNLDYAGDRDNKGCSFTVFNNGRYAKYKRGCDMAKLQWNEFPRRDIETIDVLNWRSWTESVWEDYEGQLFGLDAEEIEGVQESLANQDDVEMDEVCVFLAHACQRNIGAWMRLFKNAPRICDFADVACAKPEILKDPKIALKAAFWCCLSGYDKKGFWNASGLITKREGDFCGWELMDPAHSSWAAMLSIDPDFVSDFAWDELSGCDRCLVLAYQPHLVERIDLHELGNPCSKLWDDDESFCKDWLYLLMRQPQFEKYFTRWDKFSDSSWDTILEKQPKLARHRTT